eukprot:SAG31_NODE_2398_length_5781_cov_6.178061_7_plen_110_part_01
MSAHFTPLRKRDGVCPAKLTDRWCTCFQVPAYLTRAVSDGHDVELAMLSAANLDAIAFSSTAEAETLRVVSQHTSVLVWSLFACLRCFFWTPNVEKVDPNCSNGISDARA